jgi:hypothetical protein
MGCKAIHVTNNQVSKSHETRHPALQSVRLLDQVHERVRQLHYSLSTEKVCLYGVRFSSAGMGVGGAGQPRSTTALNPKPFHSFHKKIRP